MPAAQDQALCVRMHECTRWRRRGLGLPSRSIRDSHPQVLLRLGLLSPFCQVLVCRLWRLPRKAASSFSSQRHQARTPPALLPPRQLTPIEVAGSRGSGLTPLGSSGQAWECMSEVPLSGWGKCWVGQLLSVAGPTRVRREWAQMLILSDISGLMQLCLQCLA